MWCGMFKYKFGPGKLILPKPLIKVVVCLSGHFRLNFVFHKSICSDRKEKQKQLAGRLANIQDAKVLALQEKLNQRKEGTWYRFYLQYSVYMHMCVYVCWCVCLHQF